MPKPTPSQTVPEELQGAAKVSDVNALDEKLERAYSKDRYEEFQSAVKKIVIDTLKHDDGREIIKSYAKESAKDYVNERGLTRLNFWLPIAVGALIALLPYIIKLIKYLAGIH